MATDEPASCGTPFSQRPSVVFPTVVVIVCCIVLSLWLKVPGLILSTFILLGTFFLVNQDQKSTERDALIMSIRLSSEDIENTLEQYSTFLNGTDTDALADRTLHRPELANQDSEDPDIEAFHYSARNCRRFLNRLDAKLGAETSLDELRRILTATDERAAQLEEQWRAARRAALRLGTSSSFTESSPNSDPLTAWNKAGIDTSGGGSWNQKWFRRKPRRAD